ncbi:hypothetical protein XELAEV_18032212mg, partial [Xenopus laevis]
MFRCICSIFKCFKKKQPEEIIFHDNCQEEPETNFGHNSCQEEPNEIIVHDNCQEVPETNFEHNSCQEEPNEIIVHDIYQEEPETYFGHNSCQEEPNEIIVHDICQEEPEDNYYYISIHSYQEQPEEPGTEISQSNASEEEENLEEQEEEENNSDDMLISSGEEESSSDHLFPSLEKQLEEIIAHDICQEEPETNIGHFQEQPEEPGTDISQGNASEEEEKLEEQAEKENNSDDMVICSDEEESIIDYLFPSLEGPLHYEKIGGQGPLNVHAIPNGQRFPQPSLRAHNSGTKHPLAPLPELQPPPHTYHLFSTAVLGVKEDRRCFWLPPRIRNLALKFTRGGFLPPLVFGHSILPEASFSPFLQKGRATAEAVENQRRGFFTVWYLYLYRWAYPSPPSLRQSPASPQMGISAAKFSVLQSHIVKAVQLFLSTPDHFKRNAVRCNRGINPYLPTVPHYTAQSRFSLLVPLSRIVVKMSRRPVPAVLVVAARAAASCYFWVFSAQRFSLSFTDSCLRSYLGLYHFTSLRWPYTDRSARLAMSPNERISLRYAHLE